MKRIAVFLFLLAAPMLKAVSLPVETPHGVKLTWNAPSSASDPVVAYNVYRSAGQSPKYAKVNSSDVTTTQYLDRPTGPVSYMYYVTALDAARNESVPSNTASVTVPYVPSVPTLGVVTVK